MAAAISEFLEAIDSYMAKNAKGGDKFLASKLSTVFDDVRSPFSTKRGGLLSVISEKMNKLANQLEHITDNTKVFEYLNNGTRDLVVDVNVLGDRMRTAAKGLDEFIKNIGGSIQHINIPNITQPATSIPIPSGIPFTGEVAISRIDRAVWQEAVPVVLEAWDKYRKAKPPEEVSIWRKFINNFNKPREDIFGEQRNRQSNIIRSDRPYRHMDRIYDSRSSLREEKSGFWSTMFGWMSKILLVVGGIAGLGKLGDWMKNSPVGQAVMNVTKSIFGGIVNRIQEYFMGKKGEEKSLFHQHFDSMWNNILAPVGDLIINIKEYFADRFEGLGTIIQKGGVAGITKLFMGLADNLTFGLTSMITKGIGSLAKSGGIKIFEKMGLSFGAKLLKVLKFIPFIGTLISLHSASKRIESGDYVGATLDVASGIASIFPGVGTAISIGLDVFNAFLDYKQDGTGLSKGQMIGNFFQPLKDWAANTFTVENMKNIPIIGGFIRLGEGINQIVNGDTWEGMKTLFKAIGWMTPLPMLGNILGFVDMMGGTSLTANIPDNIKQMLNPDVFVEKIVRFMGGLISNITDLIGSIIDQAVTFVKEIPNKINNLIEDAKTKLNDLREETGNKIGDKISDVIGFNPDRPAITQEEIRKKLDSVRAARETPRVPVNDAIIVEPHSKDQVLAAKSDGPIDQALKHMVATLEEEVGLLRQGFAALIHATTNGSNVVASAVAASTSVPGTTGGYDPIGDKRQYYRRVIDGK